MFFQCYYGRQHLFLQSYVVVNGTCVVSAVALTARRTCASFAVCKSIYLFTTRRFFSPRFYWPGFPRASVNDRVLQRCARLTAARSLSVREAVPAPVLIEFFGIIGHIQGLDSLP